MKRLICKITLGKFNFNFVNEIEIDSSWQTFTDKATIRIPKSLQFEGKDIIAGDNPQLKRGDPVKIELGYFPNLNTEFEGFITDIKPTLPLEIICEDEMYLIKQTNFNKSFRTVNLKVLIAEVLKESGSSLSFVANDIELGKFRIVEANGVEVFEELKKSYGIYTFIQNGTLFSGLPYQIELQNKVKYHLEKNILDSSDLVFSRNDDQKLKVKAISITDNIKIEETLGDASGESRTLYFYGLSRKELIDTATREIERIKSTSLKGVLETFGEPFIQHNDIASINSESTPEKIGDYLVKRVFTRFGMGGFRREIEPDRKV